jgi:lysozyme|tara:strand:- start:156 stop:611 length:456 start_codon:yes stop_codon:yes gene_type:complete
MNELKERIMEHEGFRDVAYNDTLGIATIGYGHMILPQDNIQIGNKYSKEFLTELFDKDFDIAVKGANKLIKEKLPHLLMLGLTDAELSKIEGVLIEMVFQMGRPRVSKFNKMFKAIDEAEWNKAADEMLDSRWAEQTFERALNLSHIIRLL